MRAVMQSSQWEIKDERVDFDNTSFSYRASAMGLEAKCLPSARAEDKKLAQSAY